MAALWASFDDLEPTEALSRMQALVAERPAGDAVALYELASAHDSLGHEQQAADSYREAFAAGLPDDLHRPAVIQYASTLRNLGRAEEGVVLLTAERDRVSDELDDAVAAFLALALVDAGRAREATGVALGALAPHLLRYTRSLSAYAGELTDPAP